MFYYSYPTNSFIYYGQTETDILFTSKEIRLYSPKDSITSDGSRTLSKQSLYLHQTEALFI